LKRFYLPALGSDLQLCSVWLFLMLCMAVVAVWGLPGAAAMSSDAATGGRAEKVPSPPVATTMSEVLIPEQSGELLASNLVSPTSFIPAVFRNSYRQAPESSFGVQMYADHIEQEAVIRAGEAGARWMRVPLFWVQIEPQNTTPEYYSWPHGYDDWLARLVRQNIKPILTVTGNPPWAATYLGGPIDRVELAEFVEFIEAAVAHYGVSPYNVKYWEFYNEPDNSDLACAANGCGHWGYEPAAYAEMLAAVYQPIKAVDPDAQVVLGGLAYDWFTSQGGPFVEDFLDGVLENNGGDYFDVMNFHYFPPFAAKWDPYGPGIMGKAAYLRNKLAEYGVYKPLICTETGTWSDDEHNGSDELQSRYVPKAFARSMAANLEITIWYKLIDDSYLGFIMWGLLDRDLNRKPSHSAYYTLARQLAPAEYVRTLGLDEIGTNQIEAHEFAALNASASIVVAWTNDESNRELVLECDSVLVVDKFGAEAQVRDGDDGAADGLIHLDIGPSPVYLRLAPGSLD
jgi:hypothetical protein